MVVTTSHSSPHPLERMNRLPLARSCRVGQIRCTRTAAAINPAASARFFLELNLCDHHPTVDGLAHVIHGEGGHADRRQGFHLHTCAAMYLDFRLDPNQVWLNGLEQELDAVGPQRVTKPESIRWCGPSRHDSS